MVVVPARGFALRNTPTSAGRISRVASAKLSLVPKPWANSNRRGLPFLRARCNAPGEVRPSKIVVCYEPRTIFPQVPRPLFFGVVAACSVA